LPFDQDTIFKALDELIEEDVLQIEGEKLYQKRMVKDNAISEARSKAGKSGGGNPNLYKLNTKQTDKQNTDIENENVIVNENINKGGAGGNLSFQNLNDLKDELLNSQTWIETVGIRHKLSVDQVKGWIELFVTDLAAKEDYGRLLKDYKQHCVNWIGSQIEKEGKLNGKKGKEYSYNEAIDLIQTGKAISFSKSFVKKGEKYILK
jgi:hypothetical protein